MMTNFSIGNDAGTKERIDIDLDRLIQTRLFISANSGGGKSFAIRKLLEETNGKVQQIVLDMEGEFGTLREKYDYILAGKEGDIQADPKTAELLARKVLELNASIIIDLYELKHHDRILFVKNFLNSMINAPKELWHPVLVVLDEAHVFAPENGKAESMEAVIGLATRGRKRGFCLCIATQRISKMHKDVCAEMINKMMGRTSLDIDMKRVSDELGFNSKQQQLSLRELNAGEFYVFGTAISNEVRKMKVGKVETTHPQAGQRIGEIKTVATEKVKSILSKLADLPKEAEQELYEKADLKKKIKELEHMLKTSAKPQIPTEQVDKIKSQSYSIGYQKGQEETKQAMSSYTKETRMLISDLEKKNEKLIQRILQAGKILGAEITVTATPIMKMPELPKPVKLDPVRPIMVQDVGSYAEPTNTTLRAGAMKMLNWLASTQETMSKNRLATLSGFSVNGGTFNTYISELKRNGWIQGNEELSITQDGFENATPEELPNGEELLRLWKSKFRDGAGKILQYIYENYPQSVSKEEIGANTGFEPSGGTFNTYISELKRNKLIIQDGDSYTLSQEFFE